jgi:hypothetical protein
VKAGFQLLLIDDSNVDNVPLAAGRFNGELCESFAIEKTYY